MENNTIQMNNLELLGRALEGRATDTERKVVLRNLSDAIFEECFMVALWAKILFDKKTNADDTVQ